MVLVLIYVFLLTVSCTAPISYQIVRFVWPRWPVGWMLLTSFCVMVLGGFIAFYWILPSAAPDSNLLASGEFEASSKGTVAITVLGYALYLLAIPAVGLTIWQLLKKGLPARAMAWRVPLAIGLAAYMLMLALLLLAGLRW
jgi:hypothetical protein